MQQQINLFQYLPQKTRSFLTPKLVALSYGALCFVLLIIYLSMWWQKHQLVMESNHTLASITSQQQQLNHLSESYPETNLKTLEKMVKLLQQQYQIKLKEKDQLSFNAYYSQYLIALGEAIVPGVWLTEIRFNRSGEKLSLLGYVIEPSLLEKFYQNLLAQPLFSTLDFKVNQIRQTRFPANFQITAIRKE